MKYEALSINELSKIFVSIDAKKELQVIILEGDLASGKTTFVKEFVKYRGYEDEVSSPTFSVQNCYGEDIFHYDIYNHGLDHFLSLGLLEEFDKKGLHFVEWGDDALVELLKNIGIEVMVIKLDKDRENRHCYEVLYA